MDLIGSLRTFGTTVVKGVFSSEEVSGLIKAYDDYLCNLTSISAISEDAVRAGKAPVAHHGVERSQELSVLLQRGKLIPIIKTLFPGGLFFCSSDLSTFVGQSPLHRDINGYFPLIKILIYLNGASSTEQGFSYIPGSHINTDIFSRSISTLMKNPANGGINAQGTLGIIDYSSLTVSPLIPTHTLRIDEGDIIIFDQRLLHGTVIESVHLRRLIALTFAPTERSLISCGPMASIPPGYVTHIRTSYGLSGLEHLSDIELYTACLMTAGIRTMQDSAASPHPSPFATNENFYKSELGSMSIWPRIGEENFNLLKNSVFRDLNAALRVVFTFDM